MSNAENHIKARVEAFVNDLSDLIRQSALEAVGEALKKGGGSAHPAAPAARRPGRPAKVVEAPVAAKPAAKVGRPAKAAGSSAASAAAAAKRRAGEKRSPVLLAQVTDQVGNHIKSNPGQGVEQIAKALSTTTKELTLPIRKLLGDKKITSKGQKRATRYFPK
ncbi:MAG: DNA-binding protein [Byssovorax sp.]